MISYIKGKLTEVLEDVIVIENSGMGYNIRVPASLLSDIPGIGTELKVYTYLYVREDAMSLYGFLTREDLVVFKLLLTVNGIGPKGALGILSTITPDQLRFAVIAGDAKMISSAPGIGMKTAQKLIIELKDKLKLEIPEMQKEECAGNSTMHNTDGKNEAVEALVALGYSSAEAVRAVMQVEDKEGNSEDILKAALKKLALV